jgi:hypothetical protein
MAPVAANIAVDAATIFQIAFMEISPWCKSVQTELIPPSIHGTRTAAAGQAATTGGIQPELRLTLVALQEWIENGGVLPGRQRKDGARALEDHKPRPLLRRVCHAGIDAFPADGAGCASARGLREAWSGQYQR